MKEILEKRCPKCEEVKPYADFRKDVRTSTGRCCWCRTCHTKRSNEANRSPSGKEYFKTYYKTRGRFKNLLREYGLTEEAYRSMLEGQNFLCALCGQPETTVTVKGDPKDFSVDHDHETGVIRGLLCHHCNTGLGAFKDNPGLLARAIQYLLAAEAVASPPDDAAYGSSGA